MTNKTPWTPGPWMVRDMHEVTALKHGVKIADAACRYSTLNEAKHNAALMALAPEMAEALRDMESWIRSLSEQSPDSMWEQLNRLHRGHIQEFERMQSILSRLPVAK